MIKSHSLTACLYKVISWYRACCKRTKEKSTWDNTSCSKLTPTYVKQTSAFIYWNLKVNRERSDRWVGTSQHFKITLNLFVGQGSQTRGPGATCGPRHPYLLTVYTSVCVYEHGGSRSAATWVTLVVRWKASLSSNLRSRLFVLQYLKFKNTNTAFCLFCSRTAEWPSACLRLTTSFKVLKKQFRVWPRGFKQSYKLAWVPTVVASANGNKRYVYLCGQMSPSICPS